MKIERIVYLGTPEFAVTPLLKLVENNYKPLLCITQPDRPKGRKKRLSPPAVKQTAAEYKIDVLQPENINSDNVYKVINEMQPELLITAAYGGYIGRRMRKLPSLGAINIHPSLLPQYRGATPVNSSLLNGDNVTGCSIFRLTARMDAGPILYQSNYRINENDNYTSLLEKLAERGGNDLLELLQNWEKGIISEIPQDDTKATYCSKLEKEDFKINWQNKAKDIYNQVRALAEKPGAYCFFREKKIKIIKCRKLENNYSAKAGTITAPAEKNGIIVSCSDKSLLLEKVQPAGKKIMKAFDFNLGARIKVGEQFS